MSLIHYLNEFMHQTIDNKQWRLEPVEWRMTSRVLVQLQSERDLMQQYAFEPAMKHDDPHLLLGLPIFIEAEMPCSWPQFLDTTFDIDDLGPLDRPSRMTYERFPAYPTLVTKCPRGRYAYTEAPQDVMRALGLPATRTGRSSSSGPTMRRRSFT